MLTRSNMINNGMWPEIRYRVIFQSLISSCVTISGSPDIRETIKMGCTNIDLHFVAVSHGPARIPMNGEQGCG